MTLKLWHTRVLARIVTVMVSHMGQLGLKRVAVVARSKFLPKEDWRNINSTLAEKMSQNFYFLLCFTREKIAVSFH